MRSLGFILAMAAVGYAGGSLVGWGLSEKEIKVAMCSYYSEWEFCKETKRKEQIRDLAISGLSKKVYELEQKLKERKEETETLCVRAYRLNIRLYPLDGKVIGIYKKGARVEVIDRIGGWVRTKEGWVSERWLEKCPQEHRASGSGSRDGLPARAGKLSGRNPERVKKPESMYRVSSTGSSEVLR